MATSRSTTFASRDLSEFVLGAAPEQKPCISAIYIVSAFGSMPQASCCHCHSQSRVAQATSPPQTSIKVFWNCNRNRGGGEGFSGIFKRSLCNTRVNSVVLGNYISFIACEPLAAELLFLAVTARQWMRGERFITPSLSHPLSSYFNYNELSLSPSKWKLQFPKMWWKAADQEANRRQWLNRIRKWFGKNLVVIMCCNARQSK